MQAARSAIEELSNRTADVAQRRVVSLQKAPRELQEEWRAAKDEFSEHKLKLIDKETKKRMLEELWHDRVDIPPEEAQQAEREMQAKKAAVTTLKKANQQRREGLREQAVNFANGVAAMREREAALASQVRKAEEANVAADEQRAKTSAHAAAAGRSREQMNECEAALAASKAECEVLTQRLGAMHKQAAEEAQRAATLTAEGDGVAARLAFMRQQAEAAAEATGERSGWYEQVNSVVRHLSGVQKVVSADGSGTTLRYELTPMGLMGSAPPATTGPGAASAPALVVRFDAGTGALLAARIEPTGLIEAPFLAALEAYAVRSNSLTALLREVQSRLELGPTASHHPAAYGGYGGTGYGSSSSSTALAPFYPGPEPFGSVDRPTPFAGAAPTPAAVPSAAFGSAQFGSAQFSAQMSAAPANVPPAATPVPRENLGARMSMAAQPAGAAGATTAAAAPPLPTPEPDPTPSVAFRPGHALPRTPAQGCSSATSAAASSVLPSPRKTDYKTEAPAPLAAPSSTALIPVIPGLRVEMIEDTGAGARRDGERRKSRKSFCRSVQHPRSPCSRAARAGIGKDPKAAMRDLISVSEIAPVASKVFSVLDVHGQVRHAYLSDGTVVDTRGELVAYIEPDGSVGDPDMNFLGEVTAANAASLGFATDKDDLLVAEVDYGRGCLRDANGSTIASLTRIGEVTGHTGQRCGTLEGFSFDMLRMAAAYLTIVDPGFLRGK